MQTATSIRADKQIPSGGRWVSTIGGCCRLQLFGACHALQKCGALTSRDLSWLSCHWEHIKIVQRLRPCETAVLVQPNQPSRPQSCHRRGFKDLGTASWSHTVLNALHTISRFRMPTAPSGAGSLQVCRLLSPRSTQLSFQPRVKLCKWSHP